jgi:hypothetical protein
MRYHVGCHHVVISCHAVTLFGCSCCHAAHVGSCCIVIHACSRLFTMSGDRCLLLSCYHVVMLVSCVAHVVVSLKTGCHKLIMLCCHSYHVVIVAILSCCRRCHVVIAAGVIMLPCCHILIMLPCWFMLSCCHVVMLSCLPRCS